MQSINQYNQGGQFNTKKQTNKKTADLCGACTHLSSM